MTYRQAADLFRAFFGVKPRKSDIVEIASQHDIALVIGHLDGVIYSTLDGERFEHRFTSTDRPLLLVSADGRQTYILKGGYRFTAKGFVG